MLSSGLFTTFADSVTADLAVVVPIALGIMATLWGLRVGISYLKGIAR